MNQNDKTAKYYDIVYKDIKGPDVIAAETELMKKIMKRGARVLDLGSGTGRNSLALANTGYRIVALDSSNEMLKQLKNKLQKTNYKRNVRIIRKDFFKVKNSEIGKFDLILMMWNSFNEIVTTKKDALRLLKKLKQVLNEKGKILINIDDTKFIQLPNINHSIIVKKGTTTYKQTWTVKKYFKAYRTAVSEERIQVYKGKTKKDDVKALIKQRYWGIEEIKSMAKSVGFRVQNRRLGVNRELYILLS